MAQTNYNLITAQTFEQYNSKLNEIFGAIRSWNSGDDFPNNPSPFDRFVRNTGDFFVRNGANTNWIKMGNVDKENFGIVIPDLTKDDLYDEIKKIIIKGDGAIIDENDVNKTIRIGADTFDPNGKTITLNQYVYETHFGLTQGQFHAGNVGNNYRLTIYLKSGDSVEITALAPDSIITFGSHKWQIISLFSGDGSDGSVITLNVRDITNNSNLDVSTANLTFSDGVNQRIKANIDRFLLILSKFEEYDQRGFSLSGYSYNTSAGITRGQFHVLEDNNGQIRLALARKEDEDIPNDFRESGVFINFFSFSWQIMRVLSDDNTTITFIVRNVGDNSDVNSIANTPNVVSFNRGINLRATALENRVDFVEQDHFIPSDNIDSLYDAVKMILVDGINTVITPNDDRHELKIDSSGSGGSGFIPNQENVYAAIKDIFIDGSNTILNENGIDYNISVDYDEKRNARGQLSFLYSDGTSESISRFHPDQLRNLFGSTSGVGISPTQKRTDIRFLISGYAPNFNTLSQLRSFTINGQTARNRTSSLVKGEYIGGHLYFDGVLVPNNFALIGELTNSQLDNLIANPGEVSFDVRYTVNSQDDIWSLRIPTLTATEARNTSPITPHIPIENIKRGIDIDQVSFSSSTIATKINGNWSAPVRLNLNSDKTKAAVTNILIPVGSGAPQRFSGRFSSAAFASNQTRNYNISGISSGGEFSKTENAGTITISSPGIYKIVAAVTSSPGTRAGIISPQLSISGNNVAIFANNSFHNNRAINSSITNYLFVEFYVSAANSVATLSMRNVGEQSLNVQSIAGVHGYRVG